MSQLSNSIEITKLRKELDELKLRVGSADQRALNEVLNHLRDDMTKIVRRLDRLEQKRG